MFAYAMSLLRGAVNAATGSFAAGPIDPPADMTGVLGFHWYKSTDQVTWVLDGTTDPATFSWNYAALSAGTWYFKSNSYNATGDSVDGYSVTAVI